MKENKYGTRHDFQTEQAETAERDAHEAELCNPTTCVYCILARDIDDMAEQINGELDKGK